MGAITNPSTRTRFGTTLILMGMTHLMGFVHTNCTLEYCVQESRVALEDTEGVKIMVGFTSSNFEKDSTSFSAWAPLRLEEC